jgi:hypothetical protein
LICGKSKQTKNQGVKKMNKAIVIGIAILVMGMVFIASIAIWFFSMTNGEVRLRTKYEMQQKVVETSLDNMRKTLINQYNVSSEFAETFIKCVAMQSEGRKGGSLFKSVTEASGNAIQGFTPELAMKMMNSIEGKMAEFKRSQDVVLDVYREHKTYCQIMPNSIFLAGKVLPEPKVISSSEAKNAIATGMMEDNIIGGNKNKILEK